MAEFQEVARHWKRMCKRYWTVTSCHGCPIAEYEKAYEACATFESDVEKMEELVMSWAAEHPEPVYPTWGEWLYEHGVVGVKHSLRYEEDWTIEHYLTPKINDSIPADLAEKLGLEPNEG